MSILPDIWAVAQEQGLSLKKVPGRAAEQRANCPFCGDDKRFHLYLNTEKGTFKCYRCGRDGGTLSFIAQLTNRGESEVLEDLRKGAKIKPAPVRHPAEKLTFFQLKEMGFLRRPNWPDLWKRDKKRARATADWIMAEWRHFVKEELARAYMRLLLAIVDGHYQSGLEAIRRRELEIGAELLAPVLAAYGKTALPDWAEEGQKLAALYLLPANHQNK